MKDFYRTRSRASVNHLNLFFFYWAWRRGASPRGDVSNPEGLSLARPNPAVRALQFRNPMTTLFDKRSAPCAQGDQRTLRVRGGTVGHGHGPRPRPLRRSRPRPWATATAIANGHGHGHGPWPRPRRRSRPRPWATAAATATVPAPGDGHGHGQGPRPWLRFWPSGRLRASPRRHPWW